MADTPVTVTNEPGGTAKCVTITSVKADVAANIATATVDAINVAGFRRGSFMSPSTGQAMTFYGCATAGGTYKLIHTSGNAALTVTPTASVGCSFFTEVFDYAWLKMVTGTSALADFTVTLKS